ncbi:hypothetical protein AK830_g231 [Neonectria ditissima]|uniref:CorA-like transporter domain-containing protein n=1 Tax=Neonectria ditissima TaxID=78410 RepID=A0A0P7BHK8_9HYPO|nr:hypothetical protein AK830_g231 [Neonectria ditissima]
MHIENAINIHFPEPADAIFSADSDSYLDWLEFIDPTAIEKPNTDRLRDHSERIRDERDLKERFSTAHFKRRIARSIIYQPYSWAPLEISKSMMQLLITLMGATHEIWDVVLSFRAQNSDVEQAFSTCSWKRHKSMREMSYVFKYPEQKALDEGKSAWVIRQIGLYHQYSISLEKNSWLIVFPNHHSYSLEQVADIMAPNKHPLQPHISFQFAYLRNWRWYMADLEKSFQKLSMDVLHVEIEENMEFEDMYYQLSGLRSIEKKLSPLVPIFAAYERMINELRSANKDLRSRGQITRESAGDFVATLDNLAVKVQTLTANVNYLLSRVASTIQTASDTISLKSQNATEDMSNRMVIDSAAIRVITVATLVYLPASYVSGFFGMGFFDMSDDGTWIVAPSMWIYFAVAIPVSVVTLLYWKIRSREILRSRVNFSPV